MEDTKTELKSLKEVIPEVDKAITYFKTSQSDDFTMHGISMNIDIIAKYARYNETDESVHGVCDDPVGYAKYVAGAGFGRTFPEIWNALSGYLSDTDEKSPGKENVIKVLSTFARLAADSSVFAISLGECGGIQLLLEALQQMRTTHRLNPNLEEPHTQLIFHMFQILYDAIFERNANRMVYRKCKAIPLLKQWLEEGVNAMFQLQALMILAYVVDYSEREILLSSVTGLQAIMEFFKAAVNSDNHLLEAASLSAFQMLDALNCLAINDSIKDKIDSAQLTPFITKMLGDDFSVPEQTAAAKALWNLAFVESIRKSNELQGVKPSKYSLYTHLSIIPANNAFLRNISTLFKTLALS